MSHLPPFKRIMQHGRVSGTTIGACGILSRWWFCDEPLQLHSDKPQTEDFLVSYTKSEYKLRVLETNTDISMVHKNTGYVYNYTAHQSNHLNLSDLKLLAGTECLV